MAARKTGASSRAAPAARPALQWATAILGGAVTLMAIGVIVWEGLQPQSPAAVTARVASVQRQANGYVLEVELHNDGLETAADVELLGVIESESASTTIDYVPGHGRATAYLYFTGDPATAKVVASGWSEP